MHHLRAPALLAELAVAMLSLAVLLLGWRLVGRPARLPLSPPVL